MISLMYHNLVARREPDLPEVDYQVTVESFSRHVRRVARRILDPLEVSRRSNDSRFHPDGCLLTFDDGAAGLMGGIETLRRHRARAVVFVCPGQLESGLWCYRLAQLLTASRVAEFRWRGRRWRLPGQRMPAHQALIGELRQLPMRRREEALSELNEALGAPGEPPSPELRTANETMLREMAESHCFVFANHTWSHSDLASLPPAEAEEEIDLAQHWLASSGLPTVPWLAFPHGRFSNRVVEVAKSRGLIPFGADTTPSHPDVCPRVGIYGRDERRWRFEAKLGWARIRNAGRPIGHTESAASRVGSRDGNRPHCVGRGSNARTY